MSLVGVRISPARQRRLIAATLGHVLFSDLIQLSARRSTAKAASHELVAIARRQFGPRWGEIIGEPSR